MGLVRRGSTRLADHFSVSLSLAIVAVPYFLLPNMNTTDVYGPLSTERISGEDQMRLLPANADCSRYCTYSVSPSAVTFTTL